MAKSGLGKVAAKGTGLKGVARQKAVEPKEVGTKEEVRVAVHMVDSRVGERGTKAAVGKEAVAKGTKARVGRAGRWGTSPARASARAGRQMGQTGRQRRSKRWRSVECGW